MEKNDEIYLKIWGIEQDHTKTRWTVYTFFASVSFAIFSLSFQDKLCHPTPSIMRLSGLVIYWFAYLLFWRFYNYSFFLRQYLKKFSEPTNLNIDKDRTEFYKDEGFTKHFTSRRVLLVLGIVYTIATVIFYLKRI